MLVLPRLDATCRGVIPFYKGEEKLPLLKCIKMPYHFFGINNEEILLLEKYATHF